MWGGREGYGPVRGWGEGGQVCMVQLSKTNGYLFAMENIYHLFLFEENRTRERKVIEQRTRPFASKCLYERRP